MADPRDFPVGKRRANLSPLMKAKAEATTGEKVNFCPFGCTTAQIDDHGYCRHLVGFTNDGKHYEPMVRGKDGRRVIRVRMAPTGETIEDTSYEDDGSPITNVIQVMAPQLEPVQRSDKLVQATVSARVYRDVDNAKVAKAS